MGRRFSKRSQAIGADGVVICGSSIMRWPLDHNKMVDFPPTPQAPLPSQVVGFVRLNQRLRQRTGTALRLQELATQLHAGPCALAARNHKRDHKQTRRSKNPNQQEAAVKRVADGRAAAAMDCVSNKQPWTV